MIQFKKSQPEERMKYDEFMKRMQTQAGLDSLGDAVKATRAEAVARPLSVPSSNY